MPDPETITQSVRNYYGDVLQSSDDLKTGTCCSAEAMPRRLRPLLANIHEEVRARFFGCGSPVPHALRGRTVLDLGCGTGRDVYLLAQLVGAEGRVIGVDMTDRQLAVAKRHLAWQMDKFGYARPNVTFHHGRIEDLRALGIADDSIDLVISNCVINLSADKAAVFGEIFRVLRPGGELCFSDVFAGRRIPDALRQDPLLLGECLAGAMYIEDFRRTLRALGCLDYRILHRNAIAIEDDEIARKAGMVDFHSMTVRTFKCDFEDVCENYGHVAWYKGTIGESPHEFQLDDHHCFKCGIPYAVCGNTARMLSETRFGAHFRLEGDFSTHFGPFDCAPPPAVLSAPGQGCC